jgi:lysyl-tRNA synthetase class 1
VFEYAEKEKARLLTPERSDGGQGSALSEIEKQEIENRIEIAKKWLEKLAPENYKFNIQENLPEKAKNLSTEQKEFLKKISEAISAKDFSGEDLHHKIHEIKSQLKIDPKVAFSSIYIVFIGKDSGPQAGWLLVSLDKNFVIKRLEEAS